jgi:tRNA pseudouridine55 synthase
MKNKYEEGQVLLINKPYDWTSFDVVRKIRNLLRIKKIGHAGTLDPLATGLLILCTGKYTKRINEYMAQEKEYTGTIVLGATTPTYDLESIPENFCDITKVSPEGVQAAASQFVGNIMQVPPIFSAIKKDGKRAYELARRGKEVELTARPVTISRFDTVVSFPEVHFTIVCSTGTYIRSLAHDLGAALGCGGYLSALCRTRIGDFRIEDAWTMQQAEEIFRNEQAAGHSS